MSLAEELKQIPLIYHGCVSESDLMLKFVMHDAFQPYEPCYSPLWKEYFKNICCDSCMTTERDLTFIGHDDHFHLYCLDCLCNLKAPQSIQ